jgi:hypothetical protein
LALGCGLVAKLGCGYIGNTHFEAIYGCEGGKVYVWVSMFESGWLGDADVFPTPLPLRDRWIGEEKKEMRCGRCALVFSVSTFLISEGKHGSFEYERIILRVTITTFSELAPTGKYRDVSWILLDIN